MESVGIYGHVLTNGRIGKADGNLWQNRQAGKVNRPMANRGPVYATPSPNFMRLRVYASPRPRAPPISRCTAHAGAGEGRAADSVQGNTI